jgi:hypothetical protein
VDLAAVALPQLVDLVLQGKEILEVQEPIILLMMVVAVVVVQVALAVIVQQAQEV